MLLTLCLPPSDVRLLVSTISSQITQLNLLAERKPHLTPATTFQISSLSSLQDTLSLILSSSSTSPTLIPSCPPSGTTHFEESPACPTPSSPPTP